MNTYGLPQEELRREYEQLRKEGARGVSAAEFSRRFPSLAELLRRDGRAAALKERTRLAVLAERRRCQEILALHATGAEHIRDECIRDGSSPGQAARRILAWLSPPVRRDPWGLGLEA